MSIIKNNKNYGTRVKIEKIEPTPVVPQYLTATYMVYNPSNSYKILNDVNNVSGWRFKGASTWETPSTTITVTNYGLTEIEFNLTDNTQIPSYMFYELSNHLVKIDFPSTLTYIGMNAFFNSGLVEMPNLRNVEFIGDDATYGCHFSISDYVVNDNVNRTSFTAKALRFDSSYVANKVYVNGMVYAAFRNIQDGCDIDLTNGIDGLPIYKWSAPFPKPDYPVNINSFKFPATLTHLAAYTFYNWNITDLYFYGTTPPVCWMFDSRDIWALAGTITNIYVPAAAVTAYQNSPDFASVASKIQAMP